MVRRKLRFQAAAQMRKAESAYGRGFRNGFRGTAMSMMRWLACNSLAQAGMAFLALAACAMSEVQKYEGGSIKHDVSVPVSKMAGFHLESQRCRLLAKRSRIVVRLPFGLLW